MKGEERSSETGPGRTGRASQFHEMRTPFAVAVLLFVVSLFFVLSLWHHDSRMQAATAESRTAMVSNRMLMAIEGVIFERLNDIALLRDIWFAGPFPHRMDRSALVAEKVIAREKTFHLINYLDTGFVCRVSVPQERGAKLVGRDLSNLPLRSEYYRILRSSAKPRMSPPMRLLSGKMGFILWYPIVDSGGFHGTLAAVFHFDDFFSEVQTRALLRQEYFRVGLGDSAVYSSFPAEADVRDLPHFSSRVLGQNWTVTALPHSETRARPSGMDLLYVLAIFFCVAVSVLAYLVLSYTIRLRKSRDELDRARQTYESIFNSVNDAIFIHDIETHRVVGVNRKAGEMFGLKPEEMVGEPMFQRAGGEGTFTKNKAYEHLRRASEGEPQVFQWRSHHSSGYCFWTEVDLKRATIDGRPRILATVRDIGPRKKMEDTLRESEERYRAIVEDQLDYIVRWHPDGTLKFANSAYCREFGIQRNQVGTHSFYDPLTDDEAAALRRKIGRLTSRNPTAVHSHRISLPRGSVGWQEWTTRVIEYADDSKSELQSVGRDISDKVEAEEQRLRVEEQLRQSQKMEAVGQLAGGVAHDFNNLLSAIIGYADILHEGLPENGPEKRFADAILNAGNRASALTNQLLAFSRKQTLELRSVNLNDRVNGIQKMLKRLIGENILMTCSLDPDLSSVKADASQVDQIILNLALNAKDAMPHGGRLIVETRNTELDEDYCREHPDVNPGPYVLMSVCDNGLGIDQLTIKKIFDPFFTTKNEGRGTGLGLSTVYGIVRQHSGHITVYSEPGKGSCFHVYFPASGVAVSEEQRRGRAQIPTGTETILVSEDEATVRNMLQVMLSTAGYTVLAAENAEEAEQVYHSSEKRIDLLVTDVIMPGRSGRSLHEELKKVRPDLKVLYVSGYTDEIIAGHGVLEDGFNFLQKPFTRAELLQKIRDVLDGRSPTL